MTTQSTQTEPTPPDLSATPGYRTAVIAAGLVAAVASAGYILGVILSGDLTNAEGQRAPSTVTEALLAGIAYVVLAISLISLANGTRLPRWPLALSAAACSLIAAQAWTTATVFADLAHKLSDDQFDQVGSQTFLLSLFYYPMAALCLIGFIALAIVGWRHKAMSRGASLLLILAGLLPLLGAFPPAGLAGGLALAWVARSARPA